VCVCVCENRMAILLLYYSRSHGLKRDVMTDPFSVFFLVHLLKYRFLHYRIVNLLYCESTTVEEPRKTSISRFLNVCIFKKMTRESESEKKRVKEHLHLSLHKK